MIFFSSFQSTNRHGLWGVQRDGLGILVRIVRITFRIRKPTNGEHRILWTDHRSYPEAHHPWEDGLSLNDITKCHRYLFITSHKGQFKSDFEGQSKESKVQKHFSSFITILFKIVSIEFYHQQWFSTFFLFAYTRAKNKSPMTKNIR